MRLNRERECRGLDEPTACDSADLGRECSPLWRCNVLDHAVAVHKVELVIFEWQHLCGICNHEWSWIIWAVHKIYAGYVEIRLKDA
jgi:hypothetical protein